MRVLMVVGAWPQPGNPVQIFVSSQIASLQTQGVETTVWNLGEHVDGWRKYLLGIVHASKQLSQYPCDLVHAHYGYSGWVARSQLRRPVVVSFMGDDLLGTPDVTGRATTSSRLVVQVNRWFARTVDAVIVKSEEMAKIVAPIKAYVVPNGVDLHHFRPVDKHTAREQLNWEKRKSYVLFAGDPAIPVKGFPLAQAVIRHVTAQFAKAVELVPLRGLTPAQVPIYLSASDALLMTSWHEGSPNTVKEALACNLPVVSVAVGDVAEVLDGVEGCRIGPRDPERLADALREVLKQEQRIEGRKALERKGLDLESVARKLTNIYREILNRTHA